eukprot:3429660-Amphidinium_carterae.1
MLCGWGRISRQHHASLVDLLPASITLEDRKEWKERELVKSWPKYKVAVQNMFEVFLEVLLHPQRFIDLMAPKVDT